MSGCATSRCAWPRRQPEILHELASSWRVRNGDRTLDVPKEVAPPAGGALTSCRVQFRNRFSVRGLGLPCRDQHFSWALPRGKAPSTWCQTREPSRYARLACQVDILATTLRCLRLKELHRMCSMSSQNLITDWIICSSRHSGSVIESKGGFLGPSCDATMRKGPATTSSPGAIQLNQSFGQS